MEKIIFCLIFGLTLLTVGSCSGNKCILSGTWRSSLGCKMTISVLGNDGEFTGSYSPAAMLPRTDVQLSYLHGVQQDARQTEKPTFGFTVKWKFSASPPDSTAVFVGQCFVNDKGEETLQTTWLLHEEARSLEDNWKATRFGKTSFTRIN